MTIAAKPVEAMTKDELREALRSPHWRIRNLYWITNKDGQAVKFRPWPEQEKFLNTIWFRNVVPKARQRGFSTAIQITALDGCIFNENYAAAVIAQDETTALQIFQKKIKFAWDRMPDLVKTMFPTRYDTKHEIVWAKGSSFLVATSTRGTTLQFLHVSEYGKICAKDPQHAEEIQEGALPSVDQNGIIVVESTVETPNGNFSDMVRQAEAIQQTGRRLSKMDYRLHFASWWDAPEYETDPSLVTVSNKDNAYFWRLEGEIGRDISPAKRAWYVSKRDNDFGGSTEKMWRQYPSTLKEAFAVSSEGIYLSTQLAKARRDNRILRLPHMAGVPVNTWWDLGIDDDNAIWLHQQVGPWDHWINFAESSGEPYSFNIRQLQEMQQEHGYVWGKHYLPHDGNQRRPGAEMLKTPADMLEDLGLRDIEIVPRIQMLSTGIDQLREDFSNYRFDAVNCAEGIKHLDGYSKSWNQRMGLFSPEPMKNGHQHAADAIRQKAQMAHLLTNRTKQTAGRSARRSGMTA